MCLNPRCLRWTEFTETPPNTHADHEMKAKQQCPCSAIRYRRKRSSKVWGYSSWNWDAECGDLMVRHASGELFRLEESSGRNKAAAGELTPRLIKPPVKGARAEIRNINGTDEVFWVLPNVSDQATASK